MTKLSIKDIKSNPNNPRIIKDDKFKKLVQSIKDFPEMADVREIVINKDNVILGGNMRFKAMKEAGWKEVPVRVVDWSEEKQRQFIIKDNVSGGEWDWDILANEWDTAELDDWGVDIPDSFGDDKEVIEDEAPEIDNSEPPKSKIGKVYKCGPHRIMCGDSTDKENVELLMGGSVSKMLFTSPPYNINSGMYETYTDNLKSQEYIDFNLNVINVWKKYLKGFLFWNISYNKNARWEFLEIMYRIIKETGLQFLELIVWDKGHGMPITAKGQLTRQYEDVLMAGDEETINKEMDLFATLSNQQVNIFNKRTGKGITNYWKIDTSGSQLDNHLACYPVKLPAKAIGLMTLEKDIVTDPFAGSGTTMIASEQMNRICYGMELDPKYVDVIRKRYWKFVNGTEEGWQDGTKAI